MPWNSTSGYSNVPLNHAALRNAIIAKGRKGRVGQVHIHGHVWVRVDGDDMVMRLHRTDIVRFHPDGSKTLHGQYWSTRLTAHWIYNATRYQPYHFKPNIWSPDYWVWCQHVFYDGMRVKGPEILSEKKLPIAYEPNAEAKALRRKLTAMAKTYKSFAQIHETSDTGFDVYYMNHAERCEKVIDAALNPTEFDLDVYRTMLALGKAARGWQNVLIGVRKAYEWYVLHDKEKFLQVQSNAVQPEGEGQS